MQSSAVLYDILAEPSPSVGPPIWIGVLLLLTTVGLFVTRKGLMRESVLISFATLLALCFGLALIVAPTISSYRFHKFVEAYKCGNYVISEGTIHDFKSMDRFGHGMESFNVNDKHFEYSDFVDVPGFRRTATFGGPLKAGMRVRVFDINGRIARIESQ